MIYHRLRKILKLGRIRRSFGSGIHRGLRFNDRRGKRIVFVPYCVLNQNARVAGAAVRPAALDELVTCLLERKIGIVQIPCPEFELLGLERAHLPIRSLMERDSGRTRLHQLAAELIQQAQAYRKCGIAVLAILGKNGSPTCGVDVTWREGLVPGAGVFTEELSAALECTGLVIPILGVEDADPALVCSRLPQ